LQKRRDAPWTGEAGDQQAGEEQETGEDSKPKRKAKATHGKELVMSLDEALSRGNRMSTEMKDTKIDAIYKALEPWRLDLGMRFSRRNKGFRV